MLQNDTEIARQIALVGARIRTARVRAGLSQTQLSEISGVHRVEISLIERGKRAPYLRTLQSLAQGVGLTPCELLRDLGAQSERSTTADAGHRQWSEESFSEGLQAARRKAGLSQRALARRAGMDDGALSLYERGVREPNVRTLLKLATTLDISATDLLLCAPEKSKSSGSDPPSSGRAEAEQDLKPPK